MTSVTKGQAVRVLRGKDAGLEAIVVEEPLPGEKVAVIRFKHDGQSKPGRNRHRRIRIDNLGRA